MRPSRSRSGSCEAVEMCQSMMRLQAEAKNIDACRHRLHRTAGEINADRRAVQQILINLVSNAIKFTPDGGDVVVGAKRIGSRLHFWVRDTGIGIAEEDFANLGKPFMQIQNDYTRRFEGTGLGLSLVKGLVALHEGTMSIESMPGEGTTVTISLPVNGPKERSADKAGVRRCRGQDEGHERGQEWLAPQNSSKGSSAAAMLFEDGAMAVGGLISRNPVLVGGSTAFLVTLFYVSANACGISLSMPAPFSPPGASRPVPRSGAETETTINIVRPGAGAPGQERPGRRAGPGHIEGLDFYSGTVDGISGPNTRKAIQAYQQKVGLHGVRRDRQRCSISWARRRPRRPWCRDPQPRPSRTDAVRRDDFGHIAVPQATPDPIASSRSRPD